MSSAYGVRMSRDAADSGAKFMHAQSSWFCCMITGAVVTLIFEYFMVQKIKELGTVSDGLPQEEQASWAQLQNLGHYSIWTAGLFSLCFICCIGGAVMFLSRYMMSTQNLKCCCITDFALGVCYACSACTLCSMMGFIFSMAAGFSDPVTMCNKYGNAVSGLQSALLTGTTTTAAPFMSPEDHAKCQKAIGIFKDLLMLFGFNTLLLSIVACCQMSNCCAGGKFAKDTQEIFDDEDDSRYGGGFSREDEEYGEGY